MTLRGQRDGASSPSLSSGRPGTDALRGPLAWGRLLVSEARARPGGSSRGQAGERQTASLFLNPSGHSSCRQKQTVLEENRDWQLLRHLPGSVEAAKWQGLRWQGASCARGSEWRGVGSEDTAQPKHCLRRQRGQGARASSGQRARWARRPSPPPGHGQARSPFTSGGAGEELCGRARGSEAPGVLCPHSEGGWWHLVPL